MDIRQIYKTDYPTVHLDEAMGNLAHSLTPGSYLVVLDEEKRIIGLIDHLDFFKNPAGKRIIIWLR